MANCARVIFLTEQIATRIRPFCARMPEAELQSLALEMARVEHKYTSFEFPRYARAIHLPA